MELKIASGLVLSVLIASISHEGAAQANPAVLAASPSIPLTIATSPPGPRQGTVTADGLNIRQAPDTTAPILYVAPQGTQLAIVGQTSRGDSIWYQVRAVSNQLPQTAGWAFSRYISVAGGSGGTSSRPPTNTLTSQAYQEGYRLGYRDGQNFKKYNSGNNPNAALQAGSGNPDPEYDRFFRQGFYAGFDAGYNGRPYAPTPRP